MNYYKEIKDQILNNEAYERIKDYSKERHRVLTYFEIGRLLHEAGKHYGESIIKKYSVQLKKEFGKKYSTRSLFKMRQFYLFFTELKWISTDSKSQKVPTLESEILNSLYLKENKNQKVPTPSKYLTDYSSIISKLTWSHYVRIFSLKDQNEILYYINLVISDRLSVRQLESRIKSKEYYRLDEKTRNKLINYEETTAVDYVKNPILINNNKNYLEITEKILQNLILENLPSFLQELGNGFSFIGNEYKIKLGDRNNYIDLLLFNYEYNCFVVVELKVTELKKEHIGQIELYMNYIDKNIKKPSHDKTIGIIICKKDNKFVIEYCSDNRISIREYKMIE